MFAALLGYNPVQTLLGPVLAHLAASHAAYLAGRSFFPSLITPTFGSGLAAIRNASCSESGPLIIAAIGAFSTVQSWRGMDEPSCVECDM